MTEQRAWPRYRTLLKAVLTFEDPKIPPVEGLLKDLSRTGARIALPDSCLLPRQFTVFIPQKRQSLRGNLRWRQGRFVGVSFETPVDLKLYAIDPLERIRQLEEELAGIRNRLANHERAHSAPSLRLTKKA